jgi:hypothetical protein
MTDPTPLITALPPTATATIAPSCPPAAVAPAAASGPLDGWLGTAILPALVAAAVALAVAAAKDHREEQRRVRQCLAEAYQAYAQYKEFPYAIRRRSDRDPAGERTRLSEALRLVQADIAYHQRWTEVEDDALGTAYNELVAGARRIVGREMQTAWNTPPISSDDEMNMGSAVDLTGLDGLERAFLEASKNHVRQVGRGFVRRLVQHPR